MLFLTGCSVVKQQKTYPDYWWKEVSKNDLHWWEISPDSVKKSTGKVILSKRNELGLLSNFAPTPFELDGKRYPNIEALWQSMKYPENDQDKRFTGQVKWPYTRSMVEKMDGFGAKKAGDLGTEIMKKLNIDWVSYNGEQFIYRTPNKGKHYQIIKQAMLAKLNQNQKVKDVLLATGDLELLPDHHTKDTDPPAWKYYKIWMEIREQLLQ